MINRRSLFLAAALVASAIAVPSAQAFDIKPYEAAAVQKAIASGKPVALHVYAPWCLQCRAQEAILNTLAPTKAYDGITFFRVSYDGQPDVVKALGVSRSTLIAYKGGKETGRMSWGTSDESVITVLKTAL